MEVDRHAKCLNSLPEDAVTVLIKVMAIGLPVDECSSETKLRNASFVLISSCLRIFKWYGCEPGEVTTILLYNLCQVVVRLSRQSECRGGIENVLHDASVRQ